jgi:hypothetical protein
MGFKETFIGTGDRYNYASLCVPTYPCAKIEDKKPMNFYSKGEQMYYSKLLCIVDIMMILLGIILSHQQGFSLFFCFKQSR